MDSNNGYIYVRNHEHYNKYNVCKLGKTKNIPDRDNTYTTGEYIRGCFVLVIEILDKQIYDESYVEKLLQKYFKNYHIKKDGGCEFYQNKIIDEIEPFLSKTNIKFKVLTEKEINNLIRNERNEKLLKKLIHNKLLSKRDKLQNQYVIDILKNLEQYNKVLVKAPTGFGKTIIMYKTINKLQPKNILILTPRLNLNKQFIETKYTQHLTIKYNYHQYSLGYHNDINCDIKHKEDIIKKIINSGNNNILLCCYQSRESLIKCIKKYKLILDLVIYDEAHFISSWIEKIKDEENKEEIFLMKNDIFIKNRIFTTATPIDEMILNNQLFGNLVEKVKIYELVNDEILCNIETIIKKLDNTKHEYSDLSKLIINSMTYYNKRKGIIYVNNCANAENLYRLIKEQYMGFSIIEPYIYVSKDILKEPCENKELIKSKKDFIDSEEELTNFEESNNKSIMIAVGKIGYGYDNSWVDFICFGDPRTSDIDIRQIVGRGLRWDKKLYPDKILHILIPCYKNEIDNSYEDNKALEAYMNYIISEYGNENIEKIIINMNKPNNNKELMGKKYNGDDIPIEIYQKWCTTGYNMYSKFMIFLKINNIYDEISYNQLKEKQEWLEDLGNLQTKYPKFCFRHIHPNNINYYWDKKEASKAYKICNNKLMNDLGREKYRRLDSRYKLNKINELDKKIPIINFDLYYPKD